MDCGSCDEGGRQIVHEIAVARVSASNDPSPLAKFCRHLNRCLLRGSPPSSPTLRGAGLAERLYNHPS